MRPSGLSVFAFAVFLSLVCVIQVETAPIEDTWASGLIHRAKRSLLWRWNMMKQIGLGCRDHYECGTNYCRKNICTLKTKPVTTKQE